MIREYLSLSRSFNASLTGLAPVMGALASGYFDLWHLVLLFLIGICGHAYGFAHNDIVDYDLDKTEKAIQGRPLVSGRLSKQQAWIFTLCVLFLVFFFGFI